MRSAGENPLAAETAGLSVVRTRYLAVMTSGSLAAMGGAFLSIGFVNSFTQNMTAGRGFIALAALIFGRWRPWGALGGDAAVRIRLGARAAAAGLLGVRRGALPGAPVRADPDRGDRRRRPLDPTRGPRSSAFEVLTVSLAR